MIFVQYYLDCLSQASYLVGDETTGRAVVVDPRRDIAEYLADAEGHGLDIELVIETHFHADFLSGHLELARATGAEIGYGAAGTAEFPIRKLGDGERIPLGEVTLEILATPGHTPESISVVIYEHAGDDVPYAVLTGDTLFIGDVGRPDLLAGAGMRPDDMARDLYRSVHSKLLTLPDETRVFPAHGAGSACGKSLSTETQSTIGEQRRTNYALAPMDVETFVDIVTEGQPIAPGYFSFDAGQNKAAHALFDEASPPPELDMAAVTAAQAEGAVLVDTRPAADFAAGHLRGAVNVGLDGRFAEYVGSVVSPESSIVLVTEPGSELEAKTRLGRIGYDRILGFLPTAEAAMAEVPEMVQRASRVTVAELAEALESGTAPMLVDIRGPGEVELGSIPGARTVPLPALRDHIGDFDPAVPVVVFCAGGYRSSAAASLLRNAGIADVSDLIGGYGAWAALERPAAVPGS